MPHCTHTHTLMGRLSNQYGDFNRFIPVLRKKFHVIISSRGKVGGEADPEGLVEGGGGEEAGLVGGPGEGGDGLVGELGAGGEEEVARHPHLPPVGGLHGGGEGRLVRHQPEKEGTSTCLTEAWL